eukprot:CAMPEP_0115049472 /NCGR_PEP_ID=MMETSP0227-20121206/1212_1 /TAXON_ID=89957 /ORGANISM="Polarella glacialis, Strain CCMP 1383" /LENGTH=73 /DNA_ID=CAMNT_0002433149 /DNA_START=250 /DNA_END=467 /DNA_ORIENTATION=+
MKPKAPIKSLNWKVRWMHSEESEDSLHWGDNFPMAFDTSTPESRRSAEDAMASLLPSPSHNNHKQNNNNTYLP